MHRLLGLVLLLLPITCLSSSGVKRTEEHSTEQLSTWNPESLPWSTVLIWTVRPSGNTLTTGVLINKSKRWVLATRHSLEADKPGVQPTVSVVWPAAQPNSSLVINTSDHYFKMRRENQIQPARVVAEDPVRDLAILQAATPAPDQCREITLDLSTIPVGAKLLGVAQPFTRGSLWHPFTANIEEHAYRRLSYAPPHLRQAVALYVARGEDPAEFGYSGSPVVHPHTGKLVGLLLAAQLDKPQSYVLISSQEIQKMLPIE